MHELLLSHFLGYLLGSLVLLSLPEFDYVNEVLEFLDISFMRNSLKDLSVFEFKTDEAKEVGNKLSHYHFLEAFTSGYQHSKTPDVSDLPTSDFHEVDSPERSTRNMVSTEKMSELDAVKAHSTSYAPGDIHQEDGFVIGASRTLVVASAYDDEDSMLHSSDLLVNLVSNEEESFTSISETSSISGDLTGSDGHPKCVAFERCHSTLEEMDDNKNTVAVCPDYVIYRNNFFLEAQLTFCSDCIKIECSEACGTEENLILVCDIADIIRISCQWTTSVDALLFKFWIRTNVGHDPEKFEASFCNVFWLEKEVQIKSLAERYKDIWDTLPDNKFSLEDEMFRTHTSFSKRYFTKIMEPFEDVIYPKGDPDAVSINKRDIELLEPDAFINDTIIDFYIKYLQNKVQPIKKSRFHFFNCFFFRKLADLDKDPGSVSEGKAAYQRVRKWTRKLNVFEKDYIFIPVNYNLHWSLLVICHPGEIVNFEDDDLKDSPKVPCILHMDSFKGSHKGLEKLLQSYLLEEWKGRHSEFPDDITSRFSNLRFVRLELPQQENSSDCGLFLLHYVELFLNEAPLCFNPTSLTKFSNFLSADWFPPSEASFKRFHIRGLLYDILRDSSQKPISSNGDFPSGDVANDIDQAAEFLSAQDRPSMSVNGSSSMLPPTAHDEIFEQTTSFMSSPGAHPLEEHGDANACTAAYVDEVEANSAKRVVPINRPTSQIHSASSYGVPYTMQVKGTVVDTFAASSTDELRNSNERCETRETTSPTVVAFPVVLDTPDTSDQLQDTYVRNSQEVVASDMARVKEHVYPPALCASETGYMEVCEKPDMSETEDGKAEHYPESDGTNVGGYLIENLDGGDQEMSCYEEVQVVDSQENTFTTSYACDDVTEVIHSDNDVTPPKRSSVSLFMQRATKRQKLEQHNIRVTRSSLKKRGA